MLKILFSVLLLVSGMHTHALESGVDEPNLTVIEENDFQQLAREMKQKKLGLLLMFHAEHCHYCKLMEDEILSPMVKSGEYHNKIMIRKLQMDEARDIRDFQGKTVEPSDLAGHYHVSVTPTLVFLDSRGREMADKMVGINTVEYFGVYLDQEIEKLQKNIQSEYLKERKTAQID